MNYSIEVLTSDKFLMFSKAVTELAVKKKSLKEEFKKVYDQYQQDIREVDQFILNEQAEFEEWKKEFETNVGDG